MSSKRKNAGEGFGFMFHGAFTKKSDAVAKEQQVPGSWVKFSMTKHGGRYIVMSARKNPMRRKGTHKDERSRKRTVSYRTTKNLEFGEFEKGEFHPWSRRPYSKRKKATRKLANNGFTLEGLKKALASPRTPEQLKPSLRARIAKLTKNPGELVVLGMGNPGRKSRKRANARKHSTKARRRNSDATERAKDLFRTFHGREPEGAFEMQRSAKARKDYTVLGPLVAIGINAEKFDQVIRAGEDWDVEQWDALPHLCFLAQSDVNKVMKVLQQPDKYLKGVPLLASSPGGKQLYVISEEPLEIDVSRFDTDASKDFVDLGEATFVNYVAMKPHDPKEWIHTFGEEGGTRPVLVYDRLNKVPMFVGGSYRVEAPGIVN